MTVPFTARRGAEQAIAEPTTALARPVRVAIVEDDPEQRRFAQALIAVRRELVLVGGYETGEAALTGLEVCGPDVVLVDIGLPGLSGIDVVERCKPRMPDVQFMMLTVVEDVPRVFAALAAGATGYLLKKDMPNRLFDAVLELWRGGSPMTGSIARHVVAALQRDEPRTARVCRNGPEELTDRESEILDLLSTGRLYKEIALLLGISKGTVNTHVRHIYEKLHVHSRGRAVHLARTLGRAGK